MDSTAAPVVAAPVAVAPAPARPVPHVTYKDGQLTIVAANIPLSDVLHEVSRVTGATLEVPAGSASEPIFANIGPGSVRDVLVALLNGTPFNYVIAGSPDAAGKLESVVLTPANQSSEVAEASESNIPAVAPMPQNRFQSPAQAQQHAAFMAAVEKIKAAALQRAEEKYASGGLRTPDSDAADTTAPASSPANSPAPDAAVPAPEAANQ
ncbi:MAG: hypothetical protein ACRD2S_03815 [Terriglobales bacterium]